MEGCRSGSTNGTWINGERLTSATISSGDEVAFGDVRYTVAPG
jgi:pSer/pThr/pTyr-binding forkhead associated (FHA) protein